MKNYLPPYYKSVIFLLKQMPLKLYMFCVLFWRFAHTEQIRIHAQLPLGAPSVGRQCWTFMQNISVSIGFYLMFRKIIPLSLTAGVLITCDKGKEGMVVIQ